MMYVLIVLLIFGSALVVANLFLTWLLAETPEERLTEAGRARRERSFYRTKTWIALRRLLAKKPLMLMSRRDRNGRFRRMSTAAARPAQQQPARRRAARPRAVPKRRSRAQAPAE